MIHTDVNECEADNGGCEELCVNTVGSHQCMCQDGYRLQEDNRGCEGIPRCLFVIASVL